MIVKQIPVGPMANFVYLLMDPETREGLVVDSGWETAPIVKAVEEAGAGVKFVVATHGHFDHTSTIRELSESLGAKVVAHEDSPIRPDMAVADGHKLKLGRGSVRVMYTPGHTEDSICLYDGMNLFTGDTLFIGTIGKFEKSSSQQMFDSLHRIITRLPDATLVLPGHDYGEVPSRTLGEERNDNPFLQTRDFRSFLLVFG